MLAGAVFLLPRALPVIFWCLAGERADFSIDMSLVLRTTAGSSMLSHSEGKKPNPVFLLAVAAPRRVESSRLLEKRSCEVGAFVSCW